MNTRHNHKPHTSSHPKAQPRERVRAPNNQTGRVVLIEPLQGHEHVIRISIETADAARQPERIIVF